MLAIRLELIRVDAVRDIDNFVRLDPTLHGHDLAGCNDHRKVNTKTFLVSVKSLSGFFKRGVKSHD